MKRKTQLPSLYCGSVNGWTTLTSMDLVSGTCNFYCFHNPVCILIYGKHDDYINAELRKSPRISAFSWFWGSRFQRYRFMVSSKVPSILNYSLVIKLKGFLIGPSFKEVEYTLTHTKPSFTLWTHLWSCDHSYDLWASICIRFHGPIFYRHILFEDR